MCVFYCSQERPCPSHFRQLCGPCAAHMSVYLPEEVLTSPAGMVSSTMKCLTNLIIIECLIPGHAQCFNSNIQIIY